MRWGFRELHYLSALSERDSKVCGRAGEWVFVGDSARDATWEKVKLHTVLLGILTSIPPTHHVLHPSSYMMSLDKWWSVVST